MEQAKGDVAIVALAIGEPYLSNWQKYCAPSWQAYAKKHGYDIIVLTEPLDRARQFGARHLNGGQRRNGDVRDVNVVEADDGEIVGNSQSRAVKLVQHADRCHIVRAHHRGREPGAGKKLFRGRDTSLQRVVALDDPFLADGDSALGQRF